MRSPLARRKMAARQRKVLQDEFPHRVDLDNVEFRKGWADFWDWLKSIGIEKITEEIGIGVIADYKTVPITRI